MTANLCFVSFLLLFSGCLGSCGRDKSKCDTANIEYEGDPVGIYCVYDESMNGFYQEKINGNTSEISATLIGRLNNGKPLSLYFPGMLTNHMRLNGSSFKFAREWSNASKSNVCYLTYAFDKTPESAIPLFLYVRKLTRSQRLQHAAKVANDFVLSIRDRCLKNGGHGCWTNMSEVTVVGFSFGAHIASQACINLYQSTGQKVGKLIGVDPAGISIFLKRSNKSFINRGNAAYVQIIHTDTLFFGTMYQCGDVDIYFKDMPVGIFKKHVFSEYLHMATAMKKLLMIAETNGKGQVIRFDKNPDQKDRFPLPDEVFVGVYDVVDDSKRGKQFYISLKNQFEPLRNSIAHVVKI